MYPITRDVYLTLNSLNVAVSLPFKGLGYPWEFLSLLLGTEVKKLCQFWALRFMSSTYFGWKYETCYLQLPSTLKFDSGHLPQNRKSLRV